ncbi:MAG TPA: non-ribosomal peptide synthetase [Burkholderiales bacterium]|nr:non-ribosomal peptide synthetase [Burkholderiales bacterium]
MVVVNCLHQLFEAQARRTPQAPAAVFEDKHLTYAELDRRANGIAQQLRRQGVGPDVTVGLHVERSLDMIVGMLGILKAGGAYVPIDTAFPAERVAYMVSDSQAKVVLTSLEGVADGDGPVDSGVQSRHLAYVIYTSGSTGKPKGVCIEHRNIVNYVHGVVERLRLEPGMTYATVSTIAADLGNTVIFPALATGGCLHIISQERAENGALLAEYFARHEIDVLKIVPSHLAALDPARVMPRKRLILGGEASRLDWIAHLRELAPRCEIYNHYGPTETTVGVLTYRLGRDIPQTQSGTLPLGIPLPNNSVDLVDGEICVSGAGVARGYLNRPELTAEKFAGGVYRTGDRGRLLADGSIEFCGRVDHQVKVNGYRVELGEIEAALREQVREAVVLLREEKLVAFVAPEVPALREHLKLRLPAYMVPSVFVPLDRLPLNANGKIDRQALAAMPLEQKAARGAARTETEKRLVEIWSGLLKAEVGVEDDVFDLGAHSLMAMKALTQIRDAFHVNLSLRNLFERPTVAGLAEAIESLWLTQVKAVRPGGGREEFVL